MPSGVFQISQNTIFKQEVSSKKIIIEANRAMLSLKKDSGKVKGSKWPETRAQWLKGGGVKCHTNWDQNDHNDGPKWSGVKNGLSVFR